MNKILQIIFFTAVLLTVSGRVDAGFTESKSYKIQVTIPESIGSHCAVQSADPAKSPHQDLMIEEVLRDHQKIELRSFVVK